MDHALLDLADRFNSVVFSFQKLTNCRTEELFAKNLLFVKIAG